MVVALVVVVVMMMFGVGAVGVFSAGRQRTEERGGSGPARFVGNPIRQLNSSERVSYAEIERVEAVREKKGRWLSTVKKTRCRWTSAMGSREWHDNFTSSYYGNSCT